MAIEFNCPFCTSTIRVPDAAAGKKGKCPRCETLILVPQVQLPASGDQAARQPSGTSEPEVSESPAESESRDVAPPPAKSPTAPAEGPDFSAWGGEPADAEPAFPGPPPAEAAAVSPEGIPVIEDRPAAGLDPQASVAQALKRRRRRSRIGFVIPLVCVLGLLVPAFWYFWTNRPVLEGDLPAEAVADFTAVGSLSFGEVPGLSREAFDATVAGLEQKPERLVSELMEAEFRGTRTTLRVQLTAGEETRFVRVDPRGNEFFKTWAAEHAVELDKPWRKELEAAALKFFNEYAQTEGRLESPGAYRDSVGVNASVKGLGYNMQAVAGKLAYNCVHEDAQGRLYFLLPHGVESFRLQGRKRNDGREPIFPGGYEVTVKVGGPTEGTKGPPEAAEDAMEKPTEGDGM